MRRNKSQTAKRRSHHGLSAARASVCECGGLRLPHRACAECGKYGGKVVIDVVAEKQREQRRMKRKEKELRASGQVSETKEKETSNA